MIWQLTIFLTAIGTAYLAMLLGSIAVFKLLNWMTL